ncbi:hypothetical protein, partial [Pseudomonas fluorescens]|uniref:hypothetical protein n=1 Tax=Pseudomonas fluorescens TaxID=294 RepID=UPI00195E42B4
MQRKTRSNLYTYDPYWQDATFPYKIAPSPISSPRAAFAAGLARFSENPGLEHLRSLQKKVVNDERKALSLPDGLH